MLPLEAVAPYAVGAAAYPADAIDLLLGIGEGETDGPLTLVGEERRHAVAALVVEHHGIHVEEAVGGLTPLYAVDTAHVPEGVDDGAVGLGALAVAGDLGLHAYGEGTHEAIGTEEALCIKGYGLPRGALCTEGLLIGTVDGGAPAAYLLALSVICDELEHVALPEGIG